MSLLKSLKGTFQSVQQDISSGFKSLTSSSEKPPEKTAKPHTPRSVNYDAGAEILQRYQTLWKDLYQYSEESAQKAETLDTKIGEIYVYYDRQEEYLAKFHEAAANLPVLLSQLQGVTDSLALVEEACDKVESALVYLEDICEEQDVVKAKAAHRKQLQVYKDKKRLELEAYRGSLAKEHAKKVEELNKKKQHVLKERYDTYGGKFEEDVDYYLKHGKPERLPSTPESERKLDLGDIPIEDDEEELDKFLESGASDRTDQTQEIEDTDDLFSGEEISPQVASEITSPWIEDDYIEKSTSLEDQTTSPLSSSSVEDVIDNNSETSPETVKEIQNVNSETSEADQAYAPDHSETEKDIENSENTKHEADEKDIDQSDVTSQETDQSEDATENSDKS